CRTRRWLGGLRERQCGQCAGIRHHNYHNHRVECDECRRTELPSATTGGHPACSALTWGVGFMTPLRQGYRMARFPLTTISVAVVASMTLSACSSLELNPYSQSEVRQRAISDQAHMYQEQEPLNQPVTFYEAAARALKYNLDYRLKLMESALAEIGRASCREGG